MRLTETDIVKNDVEMVHIYDAYTLFDLDRALKIGIYDKTQNKATTFVVVFDSRCPSTIVKHYLNVHGKEPWKVLCARAKECISMYGHFWVNTEDCIVESILVTYRVKDYIKITFVKQNNS